MRRMILMCLVMFLAAAPGAALAEKANVSGVAAALDDFLAHAPGDLAAMRTAFCAYYGKAGGEGPLARDYFDYMETYRRAAVNAANLRASLTLYESGEFPDPSKAGKALLGLAENHRNLLRNLAQKASLSVKEFETAGDFSLGSPAYEAFRRMELLAQAASELCDRIAQSAGE